MSDRFEKDIGRMLDAGAARIDQRTRDELARRRRAVLEDAPRGRPVRWLWLPAGALATALAVMLVIGPPTGNPGLPVTAAADEDADMEILLAGESLELYEDLEFYEWLDAASDAG